MATSCTPNKLTRQDRQKDRKKELEERRKFMVHLRFLHLQNLFNFKRLTLLSPSLPTATCCLQIFSIQPAFNHTSKHRLVLQVGNNRQDVKQTSPPPPSPAHSFGVLFVVIRQPFQVRFNSTQHIHCQAMINLLNDCMCVLVPFDKDCNLQISFSCLHSLRPPAIPFPKKGLSVHENRRKNCNQPNSKEKSLKTMAFLNKFA